MHRTTINFHDHIWRDIQAMKGNDPASLWIRQAVLMRIYFERGLERDRLMSESLERAKRQAR